MYSYHVGNVWHKSSEIILFKNSFSTAVCVMVLTELLYKTASLVLRLSLT